MSGRADLIDAATIAGIKRLRIRSREPGRCLNSRALSKHFGGVRAVDGLDLTVAQGEMFGLIGPNGSGKSTIVNLDLRPVSAHGRPGPVAQRGHHLRLPRTCAWRAALPAHSRTSGCSANSRVWQNLVGGAELAVEHRSEGFLRRWLGGPRPRARGNRPDARVLRSAHKRDELAANLAFGEQRRLEFARALSLQSRPCCCSTSRPRA